LPGGSRGLGDVYKRQKHLELIQVESISNSLVMTSLSALVVASRFHMRIWLHAMKLHAIHA
jgi:hypothetical protein